MSLETASYISQLQVSNPAGGDPITNGDDHIRLLKSVLKTQFPNLGTTAVSATAAQINYGVVPTGGIIMWSGSISAIPTGWGLCNGWTYALSDGSGTLVSPNLQDKFIVGAGNSYTIGSTGGASSHNHTVTINGTSLTVDQIPNIGITIHDPGHNHGVNDPGHSHGGTLSFGAPYGGGGAGTTGNYDHQTNSSSTGISIYGNTTGIWASTNGTNGNSHSHSGSVGSSSSLPPYYALAFIVKL